MTESQKKHGRFLDPLKEDDWDYLYDFLTSVNGLTPVVTLVARTTGDPFQVLISTLLSLRTRDEVTAIASKALFEVANTPQALAALSLEKIEKLIRVVGFFRVKARNIRDISQRLIDEFDGKVPSDLDILLKFKGVGRKTANLVLTEGFDLPGICVDTHVHRCMNRIGMVSTKNPEQTEFRLREVLPKRYWKDINTLLVTFGKEICRPISPLCSRCSLSDRCRKNNVSHHR